MMKRTYVFQLFGRYIVILDRKESENMAAIYVALIMKGLRTYANIPEKIKDRVKQLLIELELEHLIEE